MTAPKNLPPGPPKLPILGNLLQMMRNSHRRAEYFIELGKQYGSVVCLRLGFNYLIVLTDYDSIKQAFAHQGNVFSGRTLPVLDQHLTKGKGIMTSQGPHQREHRRFILHKLRDLGFGRAFFDDHINDAVSRLCDIFHANAGQPMTVTHPLGVSVLSNIVKILFNYECTNEEGLYILRILDGFANIPSRVILANINSFFTSLCNLQFFRIIFGVEKAISTLKPLVVFVKRLMKEHRQEVGKSSEPDDFVGFYFQEQEKHLSLQDSDWWDDEQIVHANVELLVAGTDTTKMTVTWGLLLLSIHSTIQEKMYQEIVSVLGDKCAPSTKEQPNMPICEAVVLEILRFSSLAMTAIPHCTTEATTLYGYHMPKGAVVLANLHSPARDPAVWKYPYLFDPFEHFIDSVNYTVINRDKIIPFSIGRRSCIGEALARAEIFLYLVGIVRKFVVSLPIGTKPSAEGDDSSILRNPRIATFVFTPRDL